METAVIKHKEKIYKLETKYYQEKLRLQKEVNSKVLEIKKESAQNAIDTLKTTTKQVVCASFYFFVRIFYLKNKHGADYILNFAVISVFFSKVGRAYSGT